MEFLGQDRREGLGRRANSRFILLLLILVSGLLVLSSLYSAQASVFQKAREGAMDAATPVLALLSGPISYINNVVGYVADYFAVLEENEALREENAELRQWMNEALELRRTVASYQGVQTYIPPPLAQPVDAHVIGESNDAFARSMIVNAGRGRNIEVGQAVVDSDGLVGRIVQAGGAASRVLLLTDIQSRIPVYIEGADVEGILVGNTQTNPVIQYVASSDPVEVTAGQRVLTSGAGGALPRDLPVGTVGGLADNNILVDLYTNYARTRVVRILNYEFPSVDEPLEGDFAGDDTLESAGEASDDLNPGPGNPEDGSTAAEG